MGWFCVLRIGVSDLHHGGGTVCVLAGEAVCAADDGAAAENMCPAVFPAEDGPLGEDRETAQGCGTVVTDGGICQNAVIECNIDTIVIAIESHRLYFDTCVEKLSAPYFGTGTGIQNGLGAGGQIDPQIFNAVFIPAGVGDFAGVDGHGLLKVIGIAAQGVQTLIGHVDTSC